MKNLLHSLLLIVSFLFFAERGWGRRLKVIIAIAILFLGNNSFAATFTENFDVAANWAGGTMTGYNAKTYFRSGQPVTFAATSLRETAGTQNGFAATRGSSTHAWRIEDAGTPSWTATVASGGVGTFSVYVRRWDNAPDPSYVCEYSINNGSTWTSVQTINNTWLGSSDWKQITGTINTSNTTGASDDIIIRIRRISGERIMIDDFEMTDYTSAINFFWNGPTTTGTNITATGGNGTWTVGGTNWVSPNNTGTGSATAWANSTSNTANFANGTGTVTMGTNITAGGTIIGTTGYTFAPNTSITLSSPVTLTNSLTIAPSTGTFTIDGIISGTGSLTQNGAGTTTLSGTNTYTGATTISQGTLSASSIVVSSNASNLGNATSPVVLGSASNAGTLSYTGSAATYTRGFTINAGGGGITNTTANLLTIGTVGITNGGTLTLANTGNGGTTISSVISSTGGVTVNNSGAGVTILSGSNTYSGTTTISAGILRLGAAGGATNTPLGTIGGGTSITSGAVLDLNGFTLGTAEGLTLNGTGISSGGGLINSSGTAVSYSGAVTLGSNSSIGTTGNITLSGIVSGAFSLTKVGSAVLTLSGANIYTGATTVSAGILRLGVASERIADASALSVATGATFDLGGFNETVGSLAGAGAVNSNTTGNLTLTAGGDNSSTTFSGVISNGTATSIALTKTGTGTLILSGANTYSGATIISAGELRLNPSANLSAAGTCHFNNGKVATTGITLGRTIAFNSLTVSENCTLELASATAHIITFTNVGTLTVGKTLTITGWAGTVGDGSSGTQGKVYIPALNCTTLTRIKFSIASVTYDAALRADGEIVPANVTTPTISSLSPSSATAGGAAFTLTVNGANFINGLSTITWGGATRTTTFVNSGQLTCTISAADIASATTVAVGVTTVCTASSTTNFVIDAPTATITTSAATLGAYCNATSNNITLNFSTTGTFTGQFNIQISNASGVFPSDATSQLLTFVSSTSTSVTATLAASYAAGTGYKVRVVNATPAYFNSGDNGSNITITAAQTPSVSINSVSSVCSNQSETFTPIPSNLGGGTASYSWTINGSAGAATGSPYTRTTWASGNSVQANMTITGGCVTATTANSSTVAPTVITAVTPSIGIAIATGANPTCTGNALTFTATPTNGGASPSYQWKNVAANVGSNSTTYSNNALADGSVITCVMTSNATCATPTTATSNAITITNNTPLQPSTITGSANITPPQTAQSYSVDNVSGVTYTWIYSGSGVTIASGQGLSAITLDFSAGATSGTLTVTPSKLGCTGTARTLAIVVNLANDNCAGAATLTVNGDETCTSTTSGTLANATQSIAAISCNSFTGNADDDVWYKFTATGTSHIVTVTPNNAWDVVVDVRSGSCNGSNINCADNVGSSSTPEVITLTGLNPTSVYFVRVYSYISGTPATPTFSVCVTTPLPVCLSEGFDASTFPPANWTYTNVTHNTFNPRTGARSAVFDVTNEEIISPLVNNLGKVSFWYRRSSTAPGSPKFIVYTSSTSTGPWTQIGSDITSFTTTYQQFSQPVTQANLFVRILHTRSSGTSEIYLDDFEASCVNCTPATDPSGTISGTTPACDETTLSFSGTAPSGDVYYWQNSVTGTSTTLGNAANDLTVTTSGNYYVRAFTTATSCWSTNLTAAYPVTIQTSTTSIAPATAQNIATNTNGNQLTVTEISTISSRKWMYSTTQGSGYIDFNPAQTGPTYIPNFSSANTYYVVCQSTFSNTCGAEFGNEVVVTVSVPGPPIINHTAIGNTTATTAQTAVATITSSVALSPTPTLTYRINGGSWATAVNVTNPSGNTWNFAIPGQIAGSLIEYFISATNTAGTTTSPAGVTISSAYGSFNEYAINCTPASSGTQTIAYQGFEFVGNSYTFAVQNTNTAPTDFQNFPAHPSATEWKYFNQGANGTATATDRNSCMCTAQTNSLTCTGLYGKSPGTAPTVSTICQYANGTNQRGVLSTNSSSDFPASSRIRNGSYSYQHRQNNESAQSMILFNNVVIPDYANATNIKIRVYAASISTTSGNGADNGSGNNDVVRAYVKVGTTAIPTSAIVSDSSCAFDWFLPNSDYYATNSLPSSSSNRRWDFNGANGNTTGKNMIEITVPDNTQNVRLLVSMQNNAQEEIWAVDDIQVIADYPITTTTAGRFYRSKQNGKWENISTWESSTTINGAFSQACEVPTFSNSDTIIISNGHTVRITTDKTVDQLRVLSSAKLVLSNGAYLTINNQANSTDLTVDGTYEDNATTPFGIIFNPDAKWKYNAGATIVKTSSSSVVAYKDNYENDISTIPSNASWYYRYNGSGNPSTTAVDMFYPDLFFENTFNTGNFSFNSVFMALQGSTGGFCTVKGNLNIGTTGTGSVTVYNNNLNSNPMLVLGNVTIAANSTLTNEFCNNCGAATTSIGNGTGFEVRGNVTVAGTFDINSASTGLLKFSGNTTPQTISGNGTIDIWDIEVNKTAGNSVLLDRAIDVNDDIILTSGTLNANANTITVFDDWTNTGATYTHGNNLVIFDGSANCEIRSNNQDFYKVEIATTGSGKAYPVTNDMKTVDELRVKTNGNLESPANRTIRAKKCYVETSGNVQIINAGAIRVNE